MTDNLYTNRPDNYLVWAILTTILCCLPFGIVSIVYSCKVNNLWDAGQQAQAFDASKKAKTWAIVAAVSGLVFGILYAILVGIGVAASL